MSKYPWTPETRRKREQKKLDWEGRKQLLENGSFQRFLRYLYINGGEVQFGGAGGWLPGWLVTGCELFFTDINGRIKKIVETDEGKWWLD